MSKEKGQVWLQVRDEFINITDDFDAVPGKAEAQAVGDEWFEKLHDEGMIAKKQEWHVQGNPVTTAAFLPLLTLLAAHAEMQAALQIRRRQTIRHRLGPILVDINNLS